MNQRQRQSQSHLFSLATLLQSAEARHSSSAPPPPATGDETSGLIDFFALQRRAQDQAKLAQEQRAAGFARTPVPFVASVGDVTAQGTAIGTDADILATLEAAKRKKSRLVIGGAAGGVALFLTILIVALSGGSEPVPPPAVATVVAVASPPPPPAPAVDAVVAAPAEAPAAPPATAAVSNQPPPHRAATKRKKGGTPAPRPSRPHQNLNLMKVISGGV